MPDSVMLYYVKINRMPPLSILLRVGYSEHLHFTDG